MDVTKTVLSVQEAVNIFYARHFAYDMLRRFFIEEPSKEYLKEFVQKNMIKLFPFADDSEGIRAGMNQVESYLATHDVVNIEKHYDDLHWDYTRMFVGPFELPTPPWESAYVRKDKLLFQGTTMNVRKIYEKYAIEVTDYNIEADDHIGLELDFMFHLNKFCLEVAEGGNPDEYRAFSKLIKEQHQFLQDHLLKFVPQFSELVGKEANTEFYAGLAKILHHYLQVDSEVLKQLVNTEIV
ncbi:hypothetical protein GNT69_03155 [Bacillus sp. B15-48]|nr:hypothetical protein [Bacillus sp. B15-48]